MFRMMRTCTTILTYVVLLTGLWLNGARAADAPGSGRHLGGQLLVAAPKLTDPNFSETVIVMIDHNAGGAMGLVVNRSMGEGNLKALLEGFGIESEEASGTVRLHSGGPVERDRGFILHSTDYTGPSTKAINDEIAVSSGRDILSAIGAGEGPREARFILGYAGWGAGQLESEMAREDWLTAPADPSLVFSEDLDAIWQGAIDSGGLAL